MNNTNETTPDSEPCSAADALKRARAELEKAQEFYESLRQQATERLKAVRETNVGTVLDGTVDAIKRHPGAALGVVAVLGFYIGRMFRR